MMAFASINAVCRDLSHIHSAQHRNMNKFAQNFVKYHSNSLTYFPIPRIAGDVITIINSVEVIDADYTTINGTPIADLLITRHI